LAGLVLAQPSPLTPPLASQLVALAEDQVNVTACPTMIAVGAAVKITLGTTTATVTLAVSLTPSATQVNV
jgi:hypothetical protein